MDLMIVSSPVSVKGEIKLINDLFNNGLDVFHLRKPEWGIAECKEILNGIDMQYHNRIALHQHHELRFDYGIERLHFPEKQRKELFEHMTETKRLTLAGSYQGKILSTSVHVMEDVETLCDFDYTFFGPVFNSYSKPGYKGVSENGAGLKKDQYHLRKKNTRVIALGGIGLNTIGRMKRMGFDGAAMLGWIWNDSLKAIDNFKKVKCWVNDHM
jgi:thiamine-phosphate pyrophosphorylase